MSKVPGTGNDRPGGFTNAAELSVSALFTMLWDALADLLGPAATAVLVKRAARRAAARSPELAELVIQRQGLIYIYSCPSCWSGTSAGTPPALRDLIDELRPLLIEMTGQLAVQHLEQIIELRARGLFAPSEERK
jgi:hypothetical protein